MAGMNVLKHCDTICCHIALLPGHEEGGVLLYAGGRAGYSPEYLVSISSRILLISSGSSVVSSRIRSGLKSGRFLK